MVQETNRFRRLLYYLGNGDPRTAKIWFMGIEEAQAYEKLEDIDKVPKEYGTCRGHPNPRNHTPVYDIISKIITGLQGKDWKKEWVGYRNEKLFSEGSEAFQGNLYPLGKEHIEVWPENYTKWFGLNKEEYYEKIYEEKIGRFAYLRTKREEYGRPLIFCFGSSFRSDFIRCFRLNDSLHEDHQEFRFYIDEKIILNPFFWVGGKTGMSNKRIERILELTNTSELNPFAKL